MEDLERIWDLRWNEVTYTPNLLELLMPFEVPPNVVDYARVLHAKVTFRCQGTNYGSTSWGRR